MRAIGFAIILSAAPAALCQMPAAQPDVLQSLLTEVHRLRQDIETMTVASQRVQIALYALQMQDAAVTRATQRLDNIRTGCSRTDAERQHFVAEIQRLEGVAATQGPDFQSRLSEMKIGLSNGTAALQSCQVSEAEASSQLRIDQAKLSALQDRIARLDKTLEQLGAVDK